MGSFIVKQPNGKLARFSTVVGMITDYNMTEEEYIELCCEKAREDAKHVLENYTRDFDRIIDYFYPVNQTYPEFIEMLKEMGASEEQLQKAYIKWEEYKENEYKEDE